MTRLVIRGGRKTRVTILGGGLASLATAFSLTETPELRSRYAVTIHQRGFRLGGKCASSRREDHYARIEEHGLHVWMGCYENAFRMIRAAYAELDRAPDAPMASWERAFVKHSFVTLTELVDDRWVDWRFFFPENDRTPGDGGLVLSLLEYVKMLPQPLGHVLRSETLGRSLGASKDRVLRALVDLAAAAPKAIESGSLDPLLPELQKVRDIFTRLARGEFLRDDLARRFWILLDLLTTIVRGIVVDRLFQRGFDTIDALDYAEWLTQHGASEIAVRSPLVRGIYDLALAYEDGDPSRPRIAAGVALRASLRMTITIKGAIFYKMCAGMGETVIAPLYEVLERRGVQFEFFHDVRELVPSSDGASVERVVIDRQATLVGDRYDPLIDVGGLPCWPAEPRYAQLAEHIALRSARPDLESAWNAWTPSARFSLEAGRDFDVLVLGISIGALPRVAARLMRVHEPFRAMVNRVGTVATQAMQLWLRPAAHDLGWQHQPTVLAGFAQPFNTWADHSDLVAHEAWPPDHRPGSCAYFCGPLADASDMFEVPSDDFAARELVRVRETARGWLSTHATHLWPDALAPVSSRRQVDGARSVVEFDWDVLIDPSGARGAKRFEAQYFRANVDPSDRYVLSLPGTTAYRLRADASGFHNLILTGDWIDCGINVGCVEATVMSGMLASRAISGHPSVVVGEKDVFQ